MPAVHSKFARPRARARDVTRRNAKRRAYRSTNKRKFMTKRAPFVETKSVTEEEQSVTAATMDLLNPTDYLTLQTATPITMLNPVPFLCMQQGIGEDQMIGLSVYSKYLKTKLQIKLPEGAYAIQHPCDVYLVHGFIKAPLARTSFTTPTAPNNTLLDTKTYLLNHVKDFFDQREDKLRFIPRSNTNIKILRYKRLKANRNATLGVPAQAYANSTVSPGYKTVGGNPIINESVTWKTMRKVHYTPGTAVSPTLANFYPNSDWLPFCCIYNPTFASFTAGSDYTIKVAHNTAHWYSDN